VVSISELYPYKGVDQTITLTPIELALAVFAMETLTAEGVDTDDIDDMQALIDYVLGVLMVGGSGGTVSIPIATIAFNASITTPALWLECLGQAVSRTTYAALFAAIGLTYGIGDGSTTFNVPDLQGRVAMGRGYNGSDPLRVAGQKLGTATHTLTLAETPAHSHTAVVHNNLGTSSAFARGNAASAGGTASTSSQGSGNAHQNLQPSLVFYAYIYAGV